MSKQSALYIKGFHIWRMEPSRESTLYQSLDVPYKKPATALAIDSTGAYAALGGKKGIYITDLEEPWDQPKLLHHSAKQTQWDTSVIQWNPHAEHATQIASAANKDIFLWNVDDKRSALQATFAPHSRPVADLCWAMSDPNVLATCSADTYVILWDVRAPKNPLKLKAFCQWTTGATMVRWNRRNPRLIASVHEGEVYIWDVRKESAPIAKITAHKQISSMDWSYHSETQLVTSSTDRTVKFWDFQQPSVCQAILQTGQPVSKVKYTPFGRAIMTISQRSDYAIRMWSLSDLEQPLYQFMGHKDVVSSLDWRIVDVGEDYEYQLMSWSKDQNLRFWPIEINLINSMQAREVYGTRSIVPSASTSLTKEGFGSSLGIYPIANSASPDIQGTTPGTNNGVTQSPRRSIGYPFASGSSTPNPTTSYGTSSTITNLEQEFSILQRRPIQGVVIEEASLSQRTLQLRLGRLPYLMRIKISFPSLYPNFAAPSFDFLPITEQDTRQLLGLGHSPNTTQSLLSGPSKLSEEEKLALKMRAKQLLVKVAYAFVSINLVCVDPCCTQLLELLESFHTDPKSVLQAEDPDKDLNIKPEEYYKSFSLSSGSVPSTPSRINSTTDASAEASAAASSSFPSAVHSGTLSSSIGKERTHLRLTFSEAASAGSSNSSAMTAVAFSPSTRSNKPGGLGGSSDVIMPKTKSDMNLSRFLDHDYLHHGSAAAASAATNALPSSQSSAALSSMTGGGGAAASASAKLPSSHSASSLTSLSPSSSTTNLSSSNTATTNNGRLSEVESTASVPTSTSASASTAAATAASAAPTHSATILSSPASVSSTSTGAALTSPLAQHSTNSSGGLNPNHQSTTSTFLTDDSQSRQTTTTGRHSRTASLASDILAAEKVPARVAPKPPTTATTTINNTTTSTQFGSTYDLLSPSSSLDDRNAGGGVVLAGALGSMKSISDQSSITAVSSTNTLKSTASTNSIAGMDSLSDHLPSASTSRSSSWTVNGNNPVPTPRTFGAIFFSTGSLLIYGTRQQKTRSTSNVISSSKVSNKVRTYGDFLTIISNTGKRINTRTSHPDIQYDGFLLEGEEALDIDKHGNGEEEEEEELRAGGSAGPGEGRRNYPNLPRAASTSDLPSIILDDMMEMDEHDLNESSDSFQPHDLRSGALHKVRSEASMMMLAHQSTFNGQQIRPRVDIHVEWFDNISIHDFSLLIPVSSVLAKRYTLVGTSTSAICTANLQAAKTARRKDLVKTWSIIEAQTHASVYPGVNTSGGSAPSPFGNTWAHHPLGRSLLRSMFQHYESLGDVQTLAILSCVIAGPTTAYGVRHNFPSAERRHHSSHHRSFSSGSHILSSHESLLRGAQTMPKSLPTSNYKSLAASHLGLARDKALSMYEELTSPSPSSLSSFSSFTNTNTNANADTTTRAAPTDCTLLHYSLIDQARSKQYNNYRRAYAELLYMWGEYTERARVLKYVADPETPNDGVDFAILCDRCAKPLKSPYCQSCKVYGFNCDICHVRVKGLSSFCLKCGHGGHADHLRIWFATETVCPAGCGCICLEQDM